jgi:hypothetical protein
MTTQAEAEREEAATKDKELSAAFERVRHLAHDERMAKAGREEAERTHRRVGVELANARIQLAKLLREVHPELVRELTEDAHQEPVPVPTRLDDIPPGPVYPYEPD